MKPRGPLMMEHRIIEKMIGLINQNRQKAKKTESVDPIFIESAVDFMKVYADKTHHGKEEDILFRECTKKKMSEEDTKIMNELIEEHKIGRKTVGELVKAKEDYLKGKDTLNTIIEQLDIFAELYPTHIEKEDKIFFPNSETYFREEELQEMLKEFWEFDKTMIHEKYKLTVENLMNK